MSEELTKLIDKTIGKKGRLRVPAYWMHKVLSGIVAYVREQEEKLKKSLASTSEKLDGEINEVNTQVSTISQKLPTIKSGWDNPGDRTVITMSSDETRILYDIIPSGMGVAAEGAGTYTICAFCDEQSSILTLDMDIAESLGFYKIGLIVAPTVLDRICTIERAQFPQAYAVASYQVSEVNQRISIYYYKVSQISWYYQGQKGFDASHRPNIIGSLRYIIVFNTKTRKVPSEAFFRMDDLTEIILADGTTSIGPYAFRDCTSLTSITIPNSVTSIEDYAFQECTSLTNITIPNSVTSIGIHAFHRCYSLPSIDFSNHSKVPTLGAGAFFGCSASLKIIVPDALYDEWIVASNWATYADHIVKASEYVETE